MKTNFSLVFETNYWWYWICGFWPGDRGFISTSPYTIVTVLGVLSALSFIFLHATKLFLLAKHSIMESVANCYFAFQLFFNAIPKIYYHLKNYKHIKKLLEVIDEGAMAPKNEAERKVANESLDMWRRICRSYITGCLLANVQSWVCAAFQKKHQFMTNIWVPCDIEGNLCYYVSLPLQLFGALLSSIYIFSTVITFIAFEVYIGSQFDMLAFKLRNMYELSKSKAEMITLDMAAHEVILEGELSNQFRDCINHHKAIIKFSKEMNIIFRENMLFSYMASIFSLCVCLLLCVLSENNLFAFFYLQCAVCYSLELLMTCWFGNEIICKSVELANAAYDSKWENCSLKHRKNILIFITRTQQPMQLYAIDIIPISLSVGTVIFRTSWNYFLALQHVYGNHNA